MKADLPAILRVITAAQVSSSGEPTGFKVENSVCGFFNLFHDMLMHYSQWGETPGKDGFFFMSAAWFKEFVYQIVAYVSFCSRSSNNIADYYSSPAIESTCRRMSRQSSRATTLPCCQFTIVWAP